MFKSAVLGVAPFAFVCVACLVAIVSAGLVVGFALNWMVPAIDLGVATLCGLVSVAMFVKSIKSLLLLIAVRNDPAANSNELEDDDDDLSLSDEQVESMADQLSEAILMRIVAKEAWIRPKPRSRR